MEYYSFIAGLPDISVEDTKNVITLDVLKSDIEECVSEQDKKDLNSFYYAFDNENLCNLLLKTDNDWSNLGTLSKEQVEDFISLSKEGKIHQDSYLPAYFAEFITAYYADAPIFADLSWQDQLTTLYYINAAESKNDFIKSYFEFNLNLQNILSATAARKYDIDVNKVVIGNNEVAENIRNNSSSKDFGLAPLFPFLDEVMHIEEATSTIEREQKIDALRWQWLEDNTVFHYFSKERIFAYLIKLQILERWSKMNLEEGRESFARYVKELVATVKIDIAQ